MNKITPPTKTTTLTIDQWQQKAIELFGKDPKQWKYKCASCGESQTMQEFIGAGIENADQRVFFSCIGRWVKGRGCDWTLGGLFQIHKTEVINDDGKKIPVFEFADNTIPEPAKDKS